MKQFPSFLVASQNHQASGQPAIEQRENSRWEVMNVPKREGIVKAGFYYLMALALLSWRLGITKETALRDTGNSEGKSSISWGRIRSSAEKDGTRSLLIPVMEKGLSWGKVSQRSCWGQVHGAVRRTSQSRSQQAKRVCQQSVFITQLLLSAEPELGPQRNCMFPGTRYSSTRVNWLVGCIIS